MVSNTGARNSKGDYTLSMKLRNSSSLISATSAISLCRQDVRLYVEADDKTMKIFPTTSSCSFARGAGNKEKLN